MSLRSILLAPNLSPIQNRIQYQPISEKRSTAFSQSCTHSVRATRWRLGQRLWRVRGRSLPRETGSFALRACVGSTLPCSPSSRWVVRSGEGGPHRQCGGRLGAHDRLRVLMGTEIVHDPLGHPPPRATPAPRKGRRGRPRCSSPRAPS